MEMETADSLEEQLRLAGVPPGWGELDLSQLRTPPPPPSPPRTRRSRRRLSGIQPCSSHRMTLRRRSGVAPLSPVERSLDALRLGDDEPEEPRLTSSPVPVVKDPSPPSPQPPPHTQVVDEPVAARRTGRRKSLVPLDSASLPVPVPADRSLASPPPPVTQVVKEPASARRISRRRSLVLLDPASLPVPVPADRRLASPPPPLTQVVEEPASARRTGRRRSLVPLDPASLPIPVPADRSLASSPTPQTQVVEEPASARRTSRRRSLVPLNAPPAPPSSKKSRRRSFGGRGVAERTDGDFIDLAEVVDRAGKENGWLGVEGSNSPLSSPTSAGLKRNLAAFEADSLVGGADQRQFQNSSAADISMVEVPPGPKQDHRDGSEAGTECGRSQELGTVPDPVTAAKSRRPTARGKQRRRSAGGALMTPIKIETLQEPAVAPTEDRTSADATTVTAVSSAVENMDTATIASTAVAPPVTPSTGAVLSAPSTKPEKTDFQLPPELKEYYTNGNYQPPAQTRLATIAEEEDPEGARLARTTRRRWTEIDKVRKCTMVLTPAKQRMRKLKAQRVNSRNKARCRKGRPVSQKTKKLLDARLKELDVFHQEEEARAAREREEAASLVAETPARTATGAAESKDMVKKEEESMDVEPASALPAPCEPPPPPPPPVSEQTPPSCPPLPPPGPLLPHPLPVPDLDATLTGTPARACLTPRLPSDGSADSTLSSSGLSGADLLLELTRSSADSSLTQGRLSDGPLPQGRLSDVRYPMSDGPLSQGRPSLVAGVGASPVIVGGGELDLAVLRQSTGFGDGEESASPCLGGRLNRAMLLLNDDESADV